MTKPVLSGEAFLRDVRRASEEKDAFHLWWLGQSGYLLQWQGRHMLLDPYLSDSLTAKYEGTDKPHVRMTAKVVEAAELDFIDVITSSHNHTDHLDPDTLIMLFTLNPTVRMIIPEANRQTVAERLGMHPILPTGLEDGASAEEAGFQFTGIAAAHEALETDELGRHRFLGYVIEFGPWTVYHSGDTVWYDGLVEKLAPWSIDVAILPINGRTPERRVAGNMNGPEAARLAKEIGARLVIPCHYEMFEFNTASPDEFVAEAESIGQPYRLLAAGEHWSSHELG
jgi:L-ascorbate metabolism protein UlaG (beta-lactamase superfamily)